MADVQKTSEIHPELHHYTDRAGLEGILSSGVLYATRYDCLNDATEVTHFRDGLIRAVEARLKDEIIRIGRQSQRRKIEISKLGGAAQIAKQDAKSVVDALYEINFQKSSNGLPFAVPYIVSFCSHGNHKEYERKNGLLSQWRAYGGKERYALVFETSKLDALVEKETENYFYPYASLADVIYNDDTLDFDTKFSGIIEATTFAATSVYSRRLESTNSSNLESAKRDLFIGFITASTRLKHRGFHEESEVRIVVCPQSREFIEQLHRRANKPVPESMRPKNFLTRQRSDGSAISYVKLFDWTGGRRLPLKRIIVGPSRNQDQLRQQIRRLVNDAVPVALSQTPFLPSQA